MSEQQPTEEELKNMSPEQISELQKKNCVFCKIIKGEVPSHKVYEDDQIIALLDIYPSVKGHLLVMPKEHVPIMPLIKPETFKHLFRNVKYLAKGVKQGVPSVRSTIFIANGGSAGQNSPHFLFHVIPRDSGDGLDVLNVPSNNVSQDELIEPLRNNLTAIMNNHLQKEGKMLVKQPSKQDLAEILEQNPDLKQAIIERPEELKKASETNEKFKALFQGIDIEKLSQKLKEIEAEHKKEHDKETAQPKEQVPEQAEKEPPTEFSKENAPEELPESLEPEENELDLDKITNMFSK